MIRVLRSFIFCVATSFTGNGKCSNSQRGCSRKCRWNDSLYCAGKKGSLQKMVLMQKLLRDKPVVR